ncbi:hypothetical protein Micbo1qcDRAFT_206572 [Microdochium bolleyi]|uniref:Uncharacterized protein n=1 Tax=Microdochium bolleyi TaxID=196109 RepID=A0A136IVT1_9PEZI|nr:hypothetical protein Micbo1qcDRAFT_206572 [Microdochium bolleyi]
MAAPPPAVAARPPVILQTCEPPRCEVHHGAEHSNGWRHRQEWTPDRLFDPKVLFSGDQDIEVHTPRWTYVGCGHSDVPAGTTPWHVDAIVIAIDAVTPLEGDRYRTTLAFGYWLADQSRLNAWLFRPLPEDQRDLQFYADVQAAHGALAIAGNVSRLRVEGLPLRHVVIKTSSPDLVHAMTGPDIFHWRYSGYPAHNTTFKHAQEVRQLDKEIVLLNHRRIEVSFWLVQQRRNKIAQQCAIHAVEKFMEKDCSAHPKSRGMGRVLRPSPPPTDNQGEQARPLQFTDTEYST